MKKYLTAVAFFAFAGCGSNQEPEVSRPTNAAQSAPSPGSATSASPAPSASSSDVASKSSPSNRELESRVQDLEQNQKDEKERQKQEVEDQIKQNNDERFELARQQNGLDRDSRAYKELDTQIRLKENALTDLQFKKMELNKP